MTNAFIGSLAVDPSDGTLVIGTGLFRAGRSFEARTPPDAPLDVAFDPQGPQRMLVPPPRACSLVRRRPLMATA